MPDLDLTLARRATEIPGWRWMPGMLQHDTDTGRGERRIRHGNWIAGSTYVPDYRDPATAGCLLELVDCCYVEHVRGAWQVTLHGGVDGVGSSLGSACIRAAETAGRWPGGAA